MKPHPLLTIISISLFSPASLALAETAVREDHSQLLVWAFLGMCALIVIIQLMPVVMLAYGLVKGLLKGKETPVAADVTAKH